MIYQEKIKILCKRRKITLKQLAEEIGMSEAGFHRSLKDNNLQVRRLLEIADFFDITLNYFFEEETNESVMIEPRASYGEGKRYIEQRLSTLEQKVEELMNEKKKNNYY